MKKASGAATLSSLLAGACLLVLAWASPAAAKAWLGVNYGALGLSSNPLDIATAVSIIRSQGFTGVKIFSGNPQLHAALNGSDLDVMTGIPNELLQRFSTSPSDAQNWVDQNVVPYYPATNFVAVAVGNEVLQQFNEGVYDNHVVGAMRSVYSALKARNLHLRIKVVSPQHNGIVQNSYPPSSTEFRDDIKRVMADMLQFLSDTGSYLVFNSYGFFAALGDPDNVPLDFVLFQSKTAGFSDNGLQYLNIFDAQFDGLVWAMEKVGMPNLPIIIGEAGWPTSGASIATPENARTYNQMLIKKVLSKDGTPKRPGAPIKTFLFEMFDEDLKPNLPGSSDGYERHWGLFTMQGVAKYNLSSVLPPTTVSIQRPPQAPQTSEPNPPNPETPAPKSPNPPAPNSPKAAPASSPPPIAPTWCVANSSFFTTDVSISNALSWACGQASVNCAPIQQGGSCYSNGNLLHLAAYAFNAYFQNNNQGAGTCDFGGAAAITNIQPFIGGCQMYSANNRWCVPRNLLLYDALSYACGNGGASCDAIQPGNSCFQPNTLLAHASYAFNSYYQIQGRKDGTCYFNGIGVIVPSDPSFPNCAFPSN